MALKAGAPGVGSTQKFDAIACGGKRAGHWCCAKSMAATGGGRVGSLTCFGEPAATYTPTAAQLPTAAVYQLSAGCDFICAVMEDGTAGAFGHLTDGELASTRHPATTIPPVASTPGPFGQAACGTFADYLLSAQGGTVAAYGRVFGSSVGPVASGTDVTALPPSVTSWSLLAANSGFGHGCAVDDAHEVRCWGADYSGQVSKAPTAAVVSGANRYLHPALFGSSKGSSSPSPAAAAAAVSSPSPAAAASAPSPATAASAAPSPATAVSAPSPADEAASSPSPSREDTVDGGVRGEASGAAALLLTAAVFVALA